MTVPQKGNGVLFEEATATGLINIGVILVTVANAEGTVISFDTARLVTRYKSVS